MIKCSVKMVFLVADGAAQGLIFILINISCIKKCSWLNELFFPSTLRRKPINIYIYIYNITWLLLTGKHLCWSLALILSVAKFPWKYFKNTYFKEHLRMATVLLKCVHETEKN